MPAYVPPHLRPNYKSTVSPPPVKIVPKRRGIHFKSNISGLRGENEKWHRFTVKENNYVPTRAEIARKHSRKIASRKVLKTPKLKSAIKGTRKVKRHIRTASPKRLQKKRKTLKSR
jgi:hypothetical protein